jgi:hypothetical protein
VRTKPQQFFDSLFTQDVLRTGDRSVQRKPLDLFQRDAIGLKLASWTGRTNRPAVIAPEAGDCQGHGFIQAVRRYFYRVFDFIDVPIADPAERPEASPSGSPYILLY